MSGGGTQAGGRDYLLQFLIPRVVTENIMRHGFAPEETPRSRDEFLVKRDVAGRVTGLGGDQGREALLRLRERVVEQARVPGRLGSLLLELVERGLVLLAARGARELGYIWLVSWSSPSMAVLRRSATDISPPGR